MRFPDFYGNGALRQRLSGALAGGGLSHCYILVGPEGSGKKTLARILAAAYQCTGDGDRPCGICPNCHKIFGGGHPDVITVDSDKATVPVSLIREMQTDAYTRPNEGRRKVYIIPRAQDMQAPAQNALLKLLEEPPSYCAFLLLTDSAEKLLTTVRSRAVELNLFPLTELDLKNGLLRLRPQADPELLATAVERSGGYLGTALSLLEGKEPEKNREHLRKFLKAFATGQEGNMLVALIPLEKLSRTELLELFSQLRLIFTRSLGHKSGGTGLYSKEAQYLSQNCTPQQLFMGNKAIAEAIEMLQSNGSAGHCVGYLMAAIQF